MYYRVYDSSSRVLYLLARSHDVFPCALAESWASMENTYLRVQFDSGHGPASSVMQSQRKAHTTI